VSRTPARQVYLPAESALLLLAGVTLIVVGALLFPIARGVLAYYEDGLFGMLLVIVSVQMLALGVTPFGEMRGSRLILPAGVCVAAFGIVTCFIPDLLGPAPRIALFVCLAPGGVVALAQMLLDRRKLRTWLDHGGVLRQLAAACAAVYTLAVIVGSLVFAPQLLPTPLTAVIALLYGVAILWLAVVLCVVYLRFPDAERPPGEERTLPISHATLLVTGVLMVLLGALLVPVSFGALPFSGSAQLGLLMLIYAIGIVTEGNTPVGAFGRSWPLIAVGVVFATLGAVSCVVPDVLVTVLGYTIGVLNIAGGSVTLARVVRSRISTRRAFGGRGPAILPRLFVTQLATNTCAIVFGVTVFLKGLLPTEVVGIVLAINGCLLLYLLCVLIALDRMQSAMHGRGGAGGMSRADAPAGLTPPNGLTSPSGRVHGAPNGSDAS